MGKFWASDSESDCEDLGDADDLGTAHRQPATFAAASDHSHLMRSFVQNELKTKAPPSTVTWQSPGQGQSQLRRSPPRGMPPPWKKIWKGPLPPRRLSPARSLGDVLLPALDAAVGRPAIRPVPDPSSSPIQISNVRVKSKPCHRTSTSVPSHHLTGPHIEPNWARPNHRLVNPVVVPEVHLRKTYAAVVMADGQGVVTKLTAVVRVEVLVRLEGGAVY